MIEPENVIPGDNKENQKIYCFKCPHCGAIFTLMIPVKEKCSISMPCPVCKVSIEWFYSRYYGIFNPYSISKFKYKWLRFIRALKPEKE
jgi:transcription elongation factor Elf1